MSPILAYYWLTPVFWALDEYLGANLRTAALEGHPWWKAAYYAFCIGIGVFATVSPDWIARLGLLEARINIALLVAGILVPYYGFIYEVAEGDIPTEPASPPEGGEVHAFKVVAACLRKTSSFPVADRRRRFRILGSRSPGSSSS